MKMKISGFYSSSGSSSNSDSVCSLKNPQTAPPQGQPPFPLDVHSGLTISTCPLADFSQHLLPGGILICDLAVGGESDFSVWLIFLGGK